MLEARLPAWQHRVTKGYLRSAWKHSILLWCAGVVTMCVLSRSLVRSNSRSTIKSWSSNRKGRSFIVSSASFMPSRCQQPWRPVWPEWINLNPPEGASCRPPALRRSKVGATPAPARPKAGGIVEPGGVGRRPGGSRLDACPVSSASARSRAARMFPVCAGRCAEHARAPWQGSGSAERRRRYDLPDSRTWIATTHVVRA